MAGKATPGAEQLGMPAFDLSALQNVLNVRLASSSTGFHCSVLCCFTSRVSCVLAQDPSIKQMAEQIAQDPAFAQMTAALQASLGTAPGEAAAPVEAPPSQSREPADVPQVDAEKYAAAMQSVLQNQQFMEMAEKLGQQIMSVCIGPSPYQIVSDNKQILADKHVDHPLSATVICLQDPGMAAMMQTMHDPSYRNRIEGKMKTLKDDPDLKGIMEEIEKGGPAAMMK